MASVLKVNEIQSDTSLPLVFSIDNVERARIDTSGNVGIGAASPGARLHVSGSNPAGYIANYVENTASNGYARLDLRIGSSGASGVGTVAYAPGIFMKIGPDANDTTTPLVFATNNATERMRLDSSGNLGLGVTPSAWSGVGPGILELRGNAYVASTTHVLSLATNTFFNGTNWVYKTSNYANRYETVFGEHRWLTAASGTAGNAITFTQAMTLDASGNLGIGTTSPESTLHVAKSSSGGKTTVYVDNPAAAAANNAASIKFSVDGGASVSNGGAEIQALINSTVNGSTHLLFSTFDGATLAERARITSGGTFLVAKTTDTFSVAGVQIAADGDCGITKSGTPLSVNRINTDGVLVAFYQDTVLEGNISVSGTAVSYNGGHLARWSQLLNGQRDESIVKGTVLSNLDEMCEWFDAEGNPLPNEQLNRMKVSDVEGDTNVAGVFVNWDNDDQDNPYDMNIAMTGDMIIRIAQGVTVQKGDLLMSAGDGTAKPQGDDIVRSKTIAKVTSNHVTCTYDDGSYCVPCVLMAC